MIEIELNRNNTQSIGQLTHFAKTLYPNNSDGFRSQADKLTAVLTEDSSQVVQDAILTMMQEHETLTVNATEPSIDADGIDETVITCPTLPTDLNYTIWLNGAIILSGTINDGTLELTVNEVGTYIVEIKKTVSNETGYIEIEGI